MDFGQSNNMIGSIDIRWRANSNKMASWGFRYAD